MSDVILRLKNTLDTDITPQTRKALHDAIHQIKLCNDEIKQLKKQIGELNAKHAAVSSAIRNCIQLLDGRARRG